MPTADLIFSCAINKVLAVIRAKLHASHLITIADVTAVSQSWKQFFGVDDTDARALEDVSYVDDCAFPVFSPAPSLCEKVQRTLTIVQNSFDAFGLTVNLKPGKN